MCGTVGSSTLTGWNRRSSAASFSRCLRYSSSVVAPTVCSSPRASIGFRMLRGVDRAFGRTGSDERVDLVDEQDDVAAGADLLEHLLQPLLEVAAVAGAGDEGAEVEGVELLARQRLGHVAGDDLLGQALDDGRLADAGLADQHRVVLRAPGEHLHDALHLAEAADHRVELLLAGELREVATELVEDLAAALVALGLRLRTGGRRRGGLRLALRALVAGQELDDLLAHAGEVGAELDEHLGGDAFALADEAEEDVLGADVVVAELQRLAQRQLEHLLRPRREGDVAGRRRAALADDVLHLVADGLERDAERLERLGGDAFALVDEPEEDVLGADVGVVEEACFLLRQHHDPAGPVGEAFEHVGDRLSDGGYVWSVYRWGVAATLPLRVVHGTRSSLAQRGRGPRTATRSFGPGRRPRSLHPVAAASPLLAAPDVRRRSPSGSKQALRESVRTPDAYLTELASHLLVAGGKRLRPVMAIVAALADGRPMAVDDVVLGGVACELVHVGSLYHDDVMDEADTRRGVETVNAKWGNLQAIVAGDFLLSRASEIAASLGTEVAGLLASTIGRLCYRPARRGAHDVPGRADGGAVLRFDRRARPRRSSPRRPGSVGSSPAPPPVDRCAHRVRPGVRDALPDRRRRARRHGDRCRARQAGRP